MEETVPCPWCEDSIATHRTQPHITEYKEVQYIISKHFYKCEKCNEEFTNDELDLRTLGQIPGSIWEEELKKFEEKSSGKPPA